MATNHLPAQDTPSLVISAFCVSRTGRFVLSHLAIRHCVILAAHRRAISGGPREKEVASRMPIRRTLLQTLGTRARDASAPILVDPARGRKWSDYGQVTLIKANRAEATETGNSHDVRPLALARHLADEHRCHIVVTLGRHGMVCAERYGAAWYLPALRVDVRDVCGAGDTVLATLGVDMARCERLHEACKRAVASASLQAAQIGVSPPSREYPSLLT